MDQVVTESTEEVQTIANKALNKITPIELAQVYIAILSTEHLYCAQQFIALQTIDREFLRYRDVLESLADSIEKINTDLVPLEILEAPDPNIEINRDLIESDEKQMEDYFYIQLRGA